MRPLINDNYPLTPAETAHAAGRAWTIARSVKEALRRFVDRPARHHAIHGGALTPALRRDLGLEPSWADMVPNVRTGITPFDGMFLAGTNDNSRNRRRAI